MAGRGGLQRGGGPRGGRGGAPPRGGAGEGGGGGLPPPVSSRARMLRPAEDARQAREFARRGVQRSLGCSATPVGGDEARRVLPGVSLPFDENDDENSSSASAAAAALVVEGGLVINPRAYLRHLWAATVAAAEAAGGRAVLDSASPPVRSLAELDRGGGEEEEEEETAPRRRRRFDVVVVAAGAASGAVAEIGGGGEAGSGGGGVGSCELVQGWTATVAPPSPSSSSSSSPSPSSSSSSSSSPFPESALLGKTYAAPRRTGSKRESGEIGGGNGGDENGENAVVAIGATRSALPVSAEEALAHCASRGRGIGPGASSDAAEASAELLERFSRLWPEAAGGGRGGKSWTVARATSGVRARPRRSGAGRPPLAGKIESRGNAGNNWWIIGGLGSRGLLYSAWLGKEVAKAALADVPRNDGGKREEEKTGDAALDPELTRWKRWKEK